MSIRDDVSVNWELDPRLISVDLPSTALGAQDAADTLRSLEHKPNPGYDVFSHDKIITLTGKQNIGGGTKVGITLVYENGQVAFGRTPSRCSGTITTGSANQLIDAAADFISDGVQRGDWCINFDDQSVTEVLSVVDANTLTVRALSDGTANTFQPGDAYKVWEVSECSIDGGNHTAVDKAQADISPLFTTFGRFAKLTASSSATLQEQALLQHSSFSGGVWLKEGSGNTGTAFPAGNEETPLEGIPDAMIVANDAGFHTLFFLGNRTLGAGDDVSGMKIVGQNAGRTTITILDAALTNNCEINESNVTGILDGGTILRYCRIQDLNFINGFVFRCELNVKVALGGVVPASFLSCYAGSKLFGTLELDCGGDGPPCTFKSFDGPLLVTNKSGSAPLELSLLNGESVTLDASCTGGDIVITGDTHIIDNSNGANVIDLTTKERIWRYDRG